MDQLNIVFVIYSAITRDSVTECDLRVFISYTGDCYINKRPIGHIAHLRNHAKPINTLAQSYNYIIMLIWRKKTIISFLIIERSLFVKPLSPFTREALSQIWLKLAQWFWRRRFLNLSNVFLLFPNHLPMDKNTVLHLNKLESPSPKDALC